MDSCNINNSADSECVEIAATTPTNFITTIYGAISRIFNCEKVESAEDLRSENNEIKTEVDSKKVNEEEFRALQQRNNEIETGRLQLEQEIQDLKDELRDVYEECEIERSARKEAEKARWDMEQQLKFENMNDMKNLHELLDKCNKECAKLQVQLDYSRKTNKLLIESALYLEQCSKKEEVYIAELGVELEQEKHRRRQMIKEQRQ